ncbi:hypothetical protein [Alteribacter natronophilus]|uniref:hypothetical protein n=1 Tax=Alteribacter natronophilus TaxID=2583810 RepID=UPI00110D8215|nr:hypothetical protein [Alteribacter natronophilus]TMW71145.1 hypothetical protein FGB90_14370 [Alteribacter natronophilus]
MSKKTYFIAFFAGMFIALFVEPVLSWFGIPTYRDLLHYMFGDPAEADVWNGVVFPLLFTAAVVGLILYIIYRFKGRGKRTRAEEK